MTPPLDCEPLRQLLQITTPVQFPTFANVWVPNLLLETQEYDTLSDLFVAFNGAFLLGRGYFF